MIRTRHGRFTSRLGNGSSQLMYRLPRILVVAGLACLTLVSSARVRVPSIDLRASRQGRIDGANAFDHAGISVSGAGDVNGDGDSDLIIGTSDNYGKRNRGRAYVIFGKSRGWPIDLRERLSGGFRIRGVAPGSFTGQSVSDAGDVNGDGLGDLIVGAPWADRPRSQNSGWAFVVFGRASSETVRLNRLGEGPDFRSL